jgi:hypothetical protein
MSTRSFMPFASFWRIVVRGSSSFVGLTPPPQRLVRELVSSARLADIESGPSARNRLTPRRLRRPFLTLMPRRVRRKRLSWLTDVHGRRRALRRAVSAERLSEAFCLRLAAVDGSAPVCRTSCLSADAALGCRTFCADAGAAVTARTSREATTKAAARGMRRP